MELKLLQVVEQKVRLWKVERRSEGTEPSQMIFFITILEKNEPKTQLNVKREKNLFEFFSFFLPEYNE